MTSIDNDNLYFPTSLPRAQPAPSSLTSKEVCWRDIHDLKESISLVDTLCNFSTILDHVEHIFLFGEMLFTVWKEVSGVHSKICGLNFYLDIPLVVYEACSNLNGVYPAVRSPSIPKGAKNNSDSITHSAEFRHKGVVWFA